MGRVVRSRTLKPGFFSNEHLCALSPEERLLFAGLWCRADRAGRLEDRPARIRADIFPYHPDLDVDAMLERLDDHDLIFRYRINGFSYIQIPMWFKHQRPHPHEVDSTIPPIPCNLADFKGCRDMVNQSRDKQLHVMTCQAGSSGPSGPSGPSGSSMAAPPASAQPAEDFSLSSPSLKSSNGNPVNLFSQQTVWFTEFWKLYFRRGCPKEPAEKAFRKHVRSQVVWGQVRAGLVAQLPGMVAKGAEFCPYPTTWLNGKQWNNEIVPVDVRVGVQKPTKAELAMQELYEQQLEREGKMVAT